MAFKNYKTKITMLQDLISEVVNLRDNINNSFLDLNCTPSEESDYNILIDTPMCDLISSIEQFIENIEHDVYDDEVEESYDDFEYEDN
jgi:hypothetical protein